MREKATFNFDGQNLGILAIRRQPSELSKYFHVAEKTCILLSRSPPPPGRRKVGVESGH